MGLNDMIDIIDIIIIVTQHVIGMINLHGLIFFHTWHSITIKIIFENHIIGVTFISNRIIGGQIITCSKLMIL